MKTFKKFLAVVLAFILVLSFAACSKNEGETTVPSGEETTENVTVNNTDKKIKVAAIKGPTGMGMVKLMENPGYEFTLTSDPTEVVSLIATKGVDIAACPLNLAANLYKKTNGNIKMLGINTLGVLSVVTNGETVNSMKDLEGKTIYTTGQGATVEFIVNHLIEKNGLKDTKVEFLSEHSELAAKVISGDAKIAILPEPFVTVATSKSDNVKVALSLTDEWNKVNPDTQLAMGCVIARADFVNENPELVSKFISDNKASVEFVNTKSLEASDKIVEKGIIDSAVFSVKETSDKKIESAKTEKAAEVISRCNIVFIDGDTMKNIADANFKVYFDADPTSIGGQLVSADLYFAK